MYSYLIEFNVKEGEEAAFVEHWSRLTEYIHQEFDGLGSRLHKTADGQYIAYAQWPDGDSRDAEHAWTTEGRELQNKMRNTLLNSRVLYKFAVVKDLLKDP
ncbi:antibiotic biosynthesis monooxygenase family protein [Halomonas binhaiensis]|uniref:Antibiotic biosynthesis monooxygenase n=1 Tax=Halomonas binhaiensis TaxID=2562282 RepID=A0A5C1NG06_9GAMM|nr:antibiotic biosynthesis monooxygenase [Halomonas binhaiensis]QEM81801.1 antibiotic biosynthesis monooxygenase [Halomonas binhaiensis]